MLTANKITRLAAIASLCLSGCSIQLNGGYSFDFQGEQATQNLDLEVPADLTQINLHNVHGNVKLEAAEDSSASANWDLTCWADTHAEADQQLERVKLVTSSNGTELDIKVELPTEDKDLLRGVRSNFVIRLPSSVIAKVRNSHGDIEATQLDAELDLHGAHGDMIVSDVIRECQLRNSHGDIELTNVPRATVDISHGDTTVKQIHEALMVDSSHGSISATDLAGDIDLSTSFDDIELRNVSGYLKISNSHGDVSGVRLNCDEVSATTSFGNIELATSAPKIVCETSHGGVNVTANNSLITDVTIKSTFDDIALHLPPGCRPAVKANASFGDVRSAFSNQAGNSPQVTLEAQHGDVNVYKLPLAEQPQ